MLVSNVGDVLGEVVGHEGLVESERLRDLSNSIGILLPTGDTNQDLKEFWNPFL